jgi:hypothetical protein
VLRCSSGIGTCPACPIRASTLAVSADVNYPSEVGLLELAKEKLMAA